MNKIKDKKRNQRSFYFNEYNQKFNSEKKNDGVNISQDRIYLLFFIFFCLIFIFATKILFVSIKSYEPKNYLKNYNIFEPLRNDIVDRNGDIIARNIPVHHAAIKPNLIKDKKKFVIKLKLIAPELDYKNIINKLEKNNYFYIKKNLTLDEKNKFWSLGEKGLLFEINQTRIYPHKNLYSHVIGQIDSDNNGISGIERFFDKDLKKINNKSIQLSLDTNLQYLIREELLKSVSTFRAKGAAGLLMDIKTGELLSLISLPDYNLNARQDIKNKNFTNKITKGVFELGSIFKTFTLALALENNRYSPDTVIKNIPDSIQCSKFTINEHDEMPSNLTLKEILVRSSNIGTIKVARSIGQDKLRVFLENLNLLNTINFELDEIGSPLNFLWNKCKLETVSYGHGITTTPLQAASAYASISNGGLMVNPTLIKDKNINFENKRIVSLKTSKDINTMLREVVTSRDGTASLADVNGYFVGGKTGTANKSINGEYTKNKLTSFISVFPSNEPKFLLFVLIDEPKPAPELIYNYRGKKISGIARNESGWNSAYVAGKILEKIGPILAINKNDFYDNYVVKKSDW